MRQAKIFVVGLLGLVLAFALPALYRYVLYAMAIGPLAMLVLGQLILPRTKRAIQVWFNPIVLDVDGELISVEPGTPVGRLSGRVLSYSYFKQWHEFTIVTHRFWLLAAVGIASLALLAFVAGQREIPMDGIGFLYTIGWICLFVTWLAWRWVWERRSLRLNGVTMSGFSVAAHKARRAIRYDFVDEHGEHRGGIFESVVCDRDDDLTIIFYDEEDPERSVPASGLIFHKLVWSEQQTSNLPYVDVATLRCAEGMDEHDASSDDPSQ